MTKADKRIRTGKTYNWTIMFVDGSHAFGQQDSCAGAAAAMRDRINNTHMDDAANMRKFFISDGSQLMEYTGSEVNDMRNW